MHNYWELQNIYSYWKQLCKPLSKARDSRLKSSLLSISKNLDLCEKSECFIWKNVNVPGILDTFLGPYESLLFNLKCCKANAQGCTYAFVVWHSTLPGSPFTLVWYSFCRACGWHKEQYNSNFQLAFHEFWVKWDVSHYAFCYQETTSRW